MSGLITVELFYTGSVFMEIISILELNTASIYKLYNFKI